MISVAVNDLIQQELVTVDQLIQQQLNSSVPLAQEIGEYIVSSGGKRIRPTLALLSAHLFDYQGNDHIILAAMIELLHTATLLHDDVIDESDRRRGQRSANVVWGNQASVLVGDLLHARSFELTTQFENSAIVAVIADATRIIVEGELLQLTHRHDITTTEAIYYQIIESKTSKLFEIACHSGAIFCQRSTEECQALANYGKYLGIAFQLLDDILDYTGDSETIGKNIGDDLAEGKPTLPLIYLLQHGSAEIREYIAAAIKYPEQSDLNAINQEIHHHGAIDYARQQANQAVLQTEYCLQQIPSSEAKTLLLEIAHSTLKRKY
ncbi:MAG: octaprenyl diphosphate synthase [Gammaproteobacteria bacterium]|nr:octaprenyl diphosphate synthase [Gammaproteobacteria bacterium]